MTQNDFGPTNIQQNNSAFFTAEFIDSSGNIIIPAGATLTVSYININNASQIDTLAMAFANSFFTATWSSTSASRGLADWSITATGFSSIAQIGQIRVIDP